MAKRQMSQREKFILALTVAVCVGALVWIGYLENFIAEYQEVSSELVTVNQNYVRQRRIIERSQAVEAAYQQIEQSLPPPIENKRPEAQFTEELARLFNQLGLDAPSISPHREEEVPGAQDFVYIVLPVTNIRGALQDITNLLMGIYERNLVVQKMRIESGGGRDQDDLRLTIDVARLVQVKDMAQTRERVVRRR